VNLSCIDNYFQTNFYTPGTSTGSFFNSNGINSYFNKNLPKKIDSHEPKIPFIQNNHFKPEILKNQKASYKTKTHNTSIETNKITASSREKLNVLII